MAVVLIVNNTDIAKVNKSIDEQAALVDSLQRVISITFSFNLLIFSTLKRCFFTIQLCRITLYTKAEIPRNEIIIK